ncbi:kinase-like protein [Mollisia scopiformis]|uniref:Kinase-like protein n=1 Tax=Mollisia scopiformis TaxID=149040 RepID=A0A194XTF6_MOLSC|nr:kinase-like protein [Mollisia scopiformis]KUJ23600.1 kinase-like protein [Mollisia scopiformis]
MSSTPSDTSSGLPLRPALKEEPTSPKCGPVKVVSIAEPEPEHENSSSTPLDETARLKQFRAGVADKRMTGRPSFHGTASSSSMLSLLRQGSLDEVPPLQQPSSSSNVSSAQHTPRHTGAGEGKHGHGLGHHLHGHGHHHDKLLSQVAEWLQAEKAKRAARKSKKRGEEEPIELDGASSRPRTGSQSSDSSAISLEKLQRILEDNMSSFGHERLPMLSPSLRPQMPGRSRRRSSARKLGAVSSDTEYQDGDVIVPSCDVVLDNSKTMSYTGGGAESSSETVTLSTSKRAEKERKAWLGFKNEIVRLAHTLRLKGWRRVPLERGGDIEVERLSGALTNAVYVVSPPKDLPVPTHSQQGVAGAHAKPFVPRPPPKLLLRVYGPQVEHLIDRENELSILRRLARKKIGPRLLGTFTNGRFEEFFNAQTLTAEDLRVEDTSKQIAKRMRELHDGIELLESEREEGPFVWRNWDKWVDRCEEVISYLDKEILSGRKGNRESWRKRGLICGVEWPLFKGAIDKYRKWLGEYYGKYGVNNRLVFAHNDTQYGNILRLVPENPTDGSTPSPLLLPQNTHKQLVVIDFEYASANTPGLEFANHFTEWCYNYHDASKPWMCNTDNYPTLEQQTRFIRSYVNHRPQFNPRASATPKLSAMEGVSRNSISDFYLDSRTPGGSSSTLDLAYDYSQEEAAREKDTERRVQELLNEVRIWRVANSAQWVAWGIVQAKVPGLDDQTKVLNGEAMTEEPGEINGDAQHHPQSEDKRPEGLKAEALLAGETVKEAEGLEDEEDEFDYLAYAQDRAMFFWGDVVGLGLVGKEELPERLREGLKVVGY